MMIKRHFPHPLKICKCELHFLDDLVEELNQQLAIQTLEIADLKKQMQLLYQRVESADLSEGVAPFDPLTNKPPHY